MAHCIPPLTGRFVRIRKDNIKSADDTLVLCEVEVKGAKLGTQNVNLNIHTHMYMYIYMCVCVCVCVCVCIYIYMYVCVCVSLSYELKL